MTVTAKRSKNVNLWMTSVIAIGLATLFFTTHLRSSLSGSPSPEINFDQFIALADSGQLNPATSAKNRSANCPRFTDSEDYVQRQHSITIGPESDWATQIQQARPNTEILLLDGRYKTDRHAILVGDQTTIRSASQNADSVTIIGQGYGISGEGLMIIGNDVSIADLSITQMRDHAIAIKPLQGAKQGTRIYNVHLYDIGTQHIKLNVGESDGGLIACSTIGYSDNGAKGDYNGAIDLHEASNWTIRDNTIYNIRGDGSGCNVDEDCGRYLSGPAILVWNNSENTRITRNRLFDNYRNIALGLGRGHSNGKIDNNLIVQSAAGDAGIELQTATKTTVENNTVILSGNYPGGIEFRDSDNIVIRNNWITSDPHDRGSNRQISIQENTVDPMLFDKLTGE